MARTKSRPQRLTKTNKVQVEKGPEFYGFTRFTSGGYGGAHYIRLKDGNDTPLHTWNEIEVLWPDATTSTHALTFETVSDSTYDRDACTSVRTTDYIPYISIEHGGTSLGKVKLTSIEKIKIRIVKKK